MTSTPGGIWIFPVMLGMCVVTIVIVYVVLPWFEARRSPKPRRKRRLPR